MSLVRLFTRLAAIGATACVAMIGAQARSADQAPVAAGSREPVGRLGPHRYATPTNQILTPAGRQIDLPGLRPQALTLSPNGELLVTSGRTRELVVIDPATGRILQRVPLPETEFPLDWLSGPSASKNRPDPQGELSYTGLVFSPDGRRLYQANANGSISAFAVAANRVSGLGSYLLPPANTPRRKEEIPSGLAVSADGRRLYVCGSLSNRLFELDAANGAVLRTWNVGMVPYDVVLAGDKAYVSNWGGRRPDADSTTGPTGDGPRIRVDPVRFIASEGSVSVVNLRRGGRHARPLKEKTEILVGRHASALALAPGGRHLVVANAASDTLSVIDTRTDRVVETIWTRQSPADLFGASPNALAFAASGDRLFVCNGTQNAVAVVAFHPGQSKLLGLIPVGWFPGAIVCDEARRTLLVANIKGVATGAEEPPGGQAAHNSKQYLGTLSFVPLPSEAELAAGTRLALDNLRYPLLAAAARPARPGQAPRPVPERVGEPSVFRHVVYIIKENRTYDQVYGDLAEGNGDPSLCVFGERITPNQHRLAREFVLLDNTYCSGILSADGHEWTDSAMATDYLERSFAGFPRSYPDGMSEHESDALAYSPAGFLWDNALAHGRTLRDYGEFTIAHKAWRNPEAKGEPKFLDCYREFVRGTDTIRLWSEPAIESLRPYIDSATVGWDLEVPDVFRAAQFIRELQQFEQTGAFPNLVIMSLPNNHTSGTNPGSPTPAAQVADNDLALGQIVVAISRSRFWKETCIFVIEDDPQAGWDHVSGYRTAALVISPYTRRKQVVSTQYNQTSVVRTIEQILGLPPMNQMDATATPMSDCFTDTPDFTPSVAVPNHVPLDQMNPAPETIADRALRRDAYASARLPLGQVDQCPEDLLNQILWRAMKGPHIPYPHWAVTAEDND